MEQNNTSCRELGGVESRREFKPYYDLLVIGAGVFGACVAWEAASRGLSVLVVDKQDFGAATSANSLKTIHGGLRYLQSLDVKSSVISSRERNTWLKIAPGLVRPLPCVLPTCSALSKNRLLVGVGLLFYNCLTFNRNKGLAPQAAIPSGKILSRNQLKKKVPGLVDRTITGGALWYDAQVIHTERLVLALLQAAAGRGADACNYSNVRFVQPLGVSKQYRVFLDDVPTGKCSELTVGMAVDCSGDGRVLESQVSMEPQLEYVKAVNLVVDKAGFEVAVGVKALDQCGMSRLLFISPWQGYTLIGTWYFPSGDGEQKGLTSKQLKQCIDQVNSAFKEPLISLGDVVQVHVGFLPADSGKVREKGADAALIRHACWVDWGKSTAELKGLYTLRGTKYTLARKAAEQAVDALKCNHRLDIAPSNTSEQALWSDLSGAKESLQGLGLGIGQIRFILDYFPMAIASIEDICSEGADMLQDVPGAAGCCRGVLEHCIRYEQVQHLEDLLVRRLPVGNAQKPHDDTINFSANLLMERNGWSAERREKEVIKLNKYYLKMNM